MAILVWRGDKLLMARRCSSEAIDEGFWGPPGGKIRVGEGVIAAAVREFIEETGGMLHGPRLVGVADSDPRGIIMFVEGTFFGIAHSMEPEKQGEWEYVDPGSVSTQIGIGALMDRKTWSVK